MDDKSGTEFISNVKFRLNVICECYDKVAALRIHEITSNSVIAEIKAAMFIVQRIQSKIKHLEHTSIIAFQLVTTSQAYLMLEKLNEIDRLTKVYRAVRILRNERSRFGKDLSPEDRRWADRYLELCRKRGLNLFRRKYAAQLLAKITETISVYRLMTIPETVIANMNLADPTNFSFNDFRGMESTIVQKKKEDMYKKNYPQGKDLLRKLVALRDTFAKLLGFANYIDFSLQSQHFTHKRAHHILNRLICITSARWAQIRDLCLEKKKIHGLPFNNNFDYKDLTYFFRILPAVDCLFLNLYFPFGKTIEKTLDLFGEYFGLRFTLKDPDYEYRSYCAWDTDTNQLLGTVVMDLFYYDTKPRLKTTIAFHEAEKGFCSDFLANLNDEFKVDSRFKPFASDGSSPLTCHIVTDIRQKFGPEPNEKKRTENGDGCTEKENGDDSCSQTKKSDKESKSLDNRDRMLTLFDILHICHELGYVLQHLFGQASSQIFRTCCSDRDFVQIPSAMLQHLILQPENILRISSADFTHTEMSAEEAKLILDWYSWEEPYKIMNLLQNGYVDYFSHMILHTDPQTIINSFSTKYMFIRYGETFLCPDLLLSLTEQKSGQHYSKLWAYHVSKLMFEATFKARGFDRQVGRDFRRYFLEPDLNVDFRVRLRNFLGEDPNSKSSLEKGPKWF